MPSLVNNRWRGVAASAVAASHDPDGDQRGERGEERDDAQGRQRKTEDREVLIQQVHEETDGKQQADEGGGQGQLGRERPCMYQQSRSGSTSSEPCQANQPEMRMTIQILGIEPSRTTLQATRVGTPLDVNRELTTSPASS